MISSWQLDPAIKGGPIHDGDSFHVLGLFELAVPIDVPGYETLGPIRLSWPVREMTRLAHCNAPELSTPAGVMARNAVLAWFEAHLGEQSSIPLVAYGRDKYKRLLCDVILPDGGKLSDFVLSLEGSVKMRLTEQLVP